MNKKYDKILERVFADPVSVDIKWRDIESMLLSLGARIEEGRGSRVKIRLRDKRAVFHQPHPEPNAKRYVVRDLREFLTEAGFRAERTGK